ncbi:hypothetical protein BGW80DRAFT_1450310 [Lactifluus volemus]|nr:hypothetical protein BGW80DRAFT_1450310 [Lactifluus volemus]
MRNKGKEEVVQAVQVGLTESVDWEKICDVLPLALRGLRRKDVHTIIVLTDNAPQGLNKSLSSFPHATKLGLFGSSTPSVTGRPYTLLYNGSKNFHGLRAITEPLKVTRSDGNLVNEPYKMNPTMLLISAIEMSALTGRAAKSDEFYLGVLRDGELWQIHRIMSGGPSRGTMALETETAPREGTSVQLFHRPNDDAVPIVWPHSSKNTLTLLAALESDSAAVEEENSVTIVEHVFVAASENGFMRDESVDNPWFTFQEKRSGIEYYITNHPSGIRLGVYTIGNSTVEEDN